MWNHGLAVSILCHNFIHYSKSSSTLKMDVDVDIDVDVDVCKVAKGRSSLGWD